MSRRSSWTRSRSTNADKRRSVEVALSEFGNLSDREIGKICAVGNKFVGDIRGQVCSEHTSPSDKRIGADGKAYPARKLPAKQAVDETTATAPQPAIPAQFPPSAGRRG